MPDLRLVYGGGEIVGFLREMLEAAERGEFESVAIATVEANGNIGSGLAFKDDASQIWARQLAAVANLQHDILTGRLTFET